jgi:4-hydroxy-tetrahydrodipicolinate synthase
MTSELDLRGVYVPLITPFTESDQVAYDEVERLTVEALDAGAAGIVALGTTGEPATLDEDEKKKIIEVIGAVCRDRGAHLSVGAGTASTRNSVAAVAAVAAAGAQSVLSVVPYYTRPTEEGVVAHFRELAAASSAPIIVYNVPYRTGRALGAASLLELASVANIAGVKQAVGGVDADSLHVLAGAPDGFRMLCGDDPYLFPLLTLGATGAIAASANMCTDAFAALVDSALKGEWARARELHEALLPLCGALFAEPNPSVIKGVLHAEGRISTPNLRMPMTKASRASVEAALQALKTTKTKLT